MIRRPPRSTQSRSSAASDVYKRQGRRVPGEGRWQAAGIGTFCGGSRERLHREGGEGPCASGEGSWPRGQSAFRPEKLRPWKTNSGKAGEYPPAALGVCCFPMAHAPNWDTRSVGLMDKASASGAGDSRFESWADHWLGSGESHPSQEGSGSKPRGRIY